MASYQYVYVMNGLGKTYPGGKEVLKNIRLSFYPGAKIGVVGHNGSGKSTLLRIMAGLDKEFVGEAWSAEGASVGYLAQEPQLDPTQNVYGNILQGLAEKKSLLDEFNALSEKFLDPNLTDEVMNDLLTEQGELQSKIETLDAWNIDRDIEVAAEALRCPAFDADVASLSGGERRRVALCQLLLRKPDLLLLDEPTNHLDAESVAWLQHFLEEYTGTVVMVTHDRYFLDGVTKWTLELDRGQGVPYEGNYSSWLEQKQKRAAQEEKGESNRLKQLESELEWIRSSPKARQAKGKARIKSYEQLLNADYDRPQGLAQIVIPHGPRLGDVVVEVNHLSKSFGDRLLIDNLSFSLPPGGIVGVIGPNGAGKSTLFRLMTGVLTADSGSIRIGDTVKMGYVDQSRDALNDQKTVWEEISDGQEEIELGKYITKSRAYCAAFNFKGSDQQKKLGQLSGGERNRVHLAKMLKQGANLLLLDEPTNDLDVDTLRALESALEEFAGCAVVISHDRWFLDRLATHILAFEGDSHVEWFEGNYEAYEEDRKRRLGVSELVPQRLKYKKFALSS
jgi:sulfate-transporting ATPase